MMINDWRNEFHAEEIKAEARLYGRYYLRVINLDVIDKLCDEVLFGIDATASSLTTQTEANELLKENQNKNPQKDFDVEKKRTPASSLRAAAGLVDNQAAPKTDNNQEVAKTSSPPAIKESKPEEVKKIQAPKQGRVAGALASLAANAFQLTPITARSKTPVSKDTNQAST